MLGLSKLKRKRWLKAAAGGPVEASYVWSHLKLANISNMLTNLLANDECRLAH